MLGTNCAILGTKCAILGTNCYLGVHDPPQGCARSAGVKGMVTAAGAGHGEGERQHTVGCAWVRVCLVQGVMTVRWIGGEERVLR